MLILAVLCMLATWVLQGAYQLRPSPETGIYWAVALISALAYAVVWPYVAADRPTWTVRRARSITRLLYAGGLAVTGALALVFVGTFVPFLLIVCDDPFWSWFVLDCWFQP